jgi:TonB family protein
VELKQNPKLQGSVAVRFSILPTGRTGEVGIEEDTLGNEAVSNCIRTVVQRWEFPFRPKEEVEVIYPFTFSPAW